MAEKTDNKLENFAILDILQGAGKALSVPEIGKRMRTEDRLGTIDYRLKGLVERGIVEVDAKNYGSKYRIAKKYASSYSYTITQVLGFTATIVFLAFGFLSITISLPMAITCLALSSLIGLAATVTNLINSGREKRKTLHDLA